MPPYHHLVVEEFLKHTLCCEVSFIIYIAKGNGTLDGKGFIITICVAYNL